MKTILLKSLAAFAAFGLPFYGFAQVSGTSSAGGSSGAVGTIPNTVAPSNGAVSSFGTMDNPAALFRQLDADGDGKLSMQEFARISSIHPNGVTGTPGASTGGSTTGSGTTGSGTTGTGSGAAGSGSSGSKSR